MTHDKATHRPKGRRRPPLAWLLARGIHRTLVGFLLVAALLGVAAGFAIHAAISGWAGVDGTGMACLAVALFLALWPLSWMASVRIAWPLQRLATVAGELRDGALGSRDQLGTAEGPPEVGQVAGDLRGRRSARGGRRARRSHAACPRVGDAARQWQSLRGENRAASPV